MEYREWGYDDRDPRDRGSAQTWQTRDDPDGSGYHQWFGQSTRATPDQPQAQAERVNGTHMAAEESTGEWSEGWLPRQRPGAPDTAAYTDYDTAAYNSVSRSDRSPPAGYDARYEVTDHAGWYEYGRYPNPVPLPAPRPPGNVMPTAPPPARPLPTVDEDEAADDPVERGYGAVLLFTVLWYAVPIGLYLLYALIFGGQAEPGCVDDAGNSCVSPRDDAVHTVVDNAIRLITALGLSLAVAIVVRWISDAWRSLTVGFAAAVVGAGVATVVFSVLSRTG